jgi:preprotein translocase subunit YajC
MDLLFPLLIVFMIGMIFFSNRQRKKQAQQQESLQSSISVGDVVVMTSGISGTVVDTDDEKTIDLEIAPDVITTWLRAAVREKLAGDADVLVGDVEHLGEGHTVVDAPHSVITDGPVDRVAPTHTTTAPASTGAASTGTGSTGTGSTGTGSTGTGSTGAGSTGTGSTGTGFTGAGSPGPAAPAAGSDGASVEPSFSDPTATPNGNGVSAGSSTPGDSRPSS